MGKIGFIGTGQMASALAAGFIRAGELAKENLFGYDTAESARKNFRENIGGTVCAGIAELIQAADTVFFSVKPQYMGDVLAAVREANVDYSSKLFVTIAAGLPIAYFEKGLCDKIRLVRVMPNTPCLVGEAASGFAVSANALPEDAQLVERLLKTVGVAYQVPEHLLDAVTGLSGSGPAYVYQMIEALSDGGVKAGLPRAIATALAAQTLKGAAEMVLKTGEHPGLLKDRVTSPGGTTIAGVAVMEERGVRSALIAAVEAATDRSAELGRR